MWNILLSEPRFTNHLPHSTLKFFKRLNLTTIQQHQLWLHFLLIQNPSHQRQQWKLLHMKYPYFTSTSWRANNHHSLLNCMIPPKIQKLNLLISTKNYIRILLIRTWSISRIWWLHNSGKVDVSATSPTKDLTIWLMHNITWATNSALHCLMWWYKLWLTELPDWNGKCKSINQPLAQWLRLSARPNNQVLRVIIYITSS